MFDIITFGSATRDLYVKSGGFSVIKDDKLFSTGEGVCLPLGSKMNVEEIRYASGGGGTNVAAMFAKQGFVTGFCGAIGCDEAGLELVKELRGLGVNLRLLVKRKERMTNHSVIISPGQQDRIILAYRGAAELMGFDDIPWAKLKTKWVYLAPLSGLLCDTFEQLVAFAKGKGIKVAVNPSKQQLALPKDQWDRILKNVDILFLNQEEASLLTGAPFQNEIEIFKKLDEMCPGVTVMTKGAEGVMASDGKYLYSAKPDPNRQIVDTTGAGDSFASGFLSDFMRNEGDIEKSIQLGLANSQSNLKEWGAKTGLLGKDEEFARVAVEKQLCSENNICLTK